MNFLSDVKWICAAEDFPGNVPCFFVRFKADEKIKRANFIVTALGVYEAEINGNRVGKSLLDPGWTSYDKRLRFKEYDVTGLCLSENLLKITVGAGWYRSRGIGRDASLFPAAVKAALHIEYADGSESFTATDESWSVEESQVRFSEIYDGEIYDASFKPQKRYPVRIYSGPDSSLIPWEGEEIVERARIPAAEIFTSPKGERIIDFGQETAGYIELMAYGKEGDEADLSFGEVLDRDGNFYNANYRSAKAQYRYIFKEGLNRYKPKFTFFGFRYARINSFPGGVSAAKTENFTAVAICSSIERTGALDCSSPLLNRFFENVVWSQTSNFIDVPTDCPQRDERLGWTGDAQVFINTACYQFDVKKFFVKWLRDVAAEQTEKGEVNRFVPNRFGDGIYGRAAWGDAAVICPWELYLFYGDKKLLAEHFPMMKKWVGFITGATKTPGLWTGGVHNGDWLALDSPQGSYKGATREDFIASAFYAYSVSLVVKAGKALGENIDEYKRLYREIVKAFSAAYPEYYTQTERVLALKFGLASDAHKTADALAKSVENAGGLQTGFVGTPYLLHVLSDYGYSRLAWSLLLKEDYPSWLYPVTKGATTVWEHWDGIGADGSFWSDAMNSFNHYAYGSVVDWVYGVAAGIKPTESAPGYDEVCIAPVPDARLDFLNARFRSRMGEIRSSWNKEGNRFRYEIVTPVPAHIDVEGEKYDVAAGEYVFFGKEIR